MQNATRLVVQQTIQNIIGAETTTSSNKNEGVFFPRIKFEKVKGKFLSPRDIAQFPVTSAFSMTFCTSKGRSFDHSGIYLFEPVYGYGQIYIELTKEGNIKI